MSDPVLTGRTQARGAAKSAAARNELLAFFAAHAPDDIPDWFDPEPPEEPPVMQDGSCGLRDGP